MYFELAYGLRVAVGRYRHEMALVAHVKARGVPMYDVQARIVQVQTLRDYYSALLAAQPLTALQPLKSR